MKIACWQAPVPGDDLARHLTELHKAAAAAAADGARLLITPEMSLTGYHLGWRRLRELAEPAGGPLCQAAAEIAADCGIALVFGWPEREGAAIHNSVGIVERDGRLLARYRKAHLYGNLDKDVFTPGEEAVVQAELDGLTLGLLICYDVEFPEAVRAHALSGTEILAVPTALMRPWEFVADVLVPARAFESQLFLAYTNWIGEEHGISYCGASRIVGPDGRLLATGTDAPALLVSDVDSDVLAAARTATTYLADRRPDLYGRPNPLA